MKRILYVSLVCVFCFIVSCQAYWMEDVPMPDPASKKENRLTVEDIKARFAKVEPQLLALTRVANPEISVIQSDFSPQWDCSIWSSDRETESIEAMIGSSTKFVAQWNAEKLVAVHQRILVTIDPQDTLPSISIETLIPTPEFYALHPDDFDQHFVNCNWRTRDFSGIILLHQFDGLLSRIVRVENGLFVASYSAYDDWMSEDDQRVESEVGFMMSGVKIYNSSSVVTRSRFIINVDPVVVTGDRKCGHCFKRICECEARIELFKKAWERQGNDLFLEGGGGGGGNLNYDEPLDSGEAQKLLSKLGSQSTIDLTPFFKDGVTHSTTNYITGIIGGVTVFINQISLSGPYPQNGGTFVVYTEPHKRTYPDLMSYPSGQLEAGVTMTCQSPNGSLCSMTITMLYSEYNKLPNNCR